MNEKNSPQQCAFIVIANGFNETETVTLIHMLRQSRLCAKIVGLTNGLINGSHGILLMPDLTLTELERSLNQLTISLLALPGEEPSLARLELDPRVHQLVRRTLEQDGIIATAERGMQLLKAAVEPEFDAENSERVIVWHALGPSMEAVARDLALKIS